MAVDVLPNPGDPQMFNSRVDWSVIRFVISLTSTSLPVKKGTALGIYGLGNVSKINNEINIFLLLFFECYSESMHTTETETVRILDILHLYVVRGIHWSVGSVLNNHRKVCRARCHDGQAILGMDALRVTSANEFQG